MHGAFYGCNQPAVAIEGLIASHIPKSQIQDVPEIYERRWWDYRRLAPGHSFYLFAHHYYKASRTAARRMIAERSRGHGFKSQRALLGPALVEMSVDGIWERDAPHITGIWKSMLISDAFGIPYPEYCRLACSVAIDRLWKQLPRPNQLYTENLVAFILEGWDELRKSRFVAGSHPIFLIENYSALQMQDNYRAYIIEQIKNVDNKVTALANVLYFRPQLPIDIARQHFNDQLIERASNLAA